MLGNDQLKMKESQDNKSGSQDSLRLLWWLAAHNMTSSVTMHLFLHTYKQTHSEWWQLGDV